MPSWSEIQNFESSNNMSNNFNNITNFNTSDSEIFQVSVLNTSESVLNELSSFIHSIVDNSKSLDADISNFVSEHFWELV